MSSWRTRRPRVAPIESRTEISLPRRRARQQQVRDVGADDQQHDDDDDGEEPGRPLRLRIDVVVAVAAERTRSSGTASPRCRLIERFFCSAVSDDMYSAMPAFAVAGTRARNSPSLLVRRARLDPAEELQPPGRWLLSCAGSAFRIRHGRGRSEYRVERQRTVTSGGVAPSRWCPELLRRDPDDRHRLAVHRHDAAADGSPANRFCQYPWLITATGGALGLSSSSPTRGRGPSGRPAP